MFATPVPPHVAGKVHVPQLGMRETAQRSVTVNDPHSAGRAVQSSASVSATQPHWFGVIAPHVRGSVHVPHVIIRSVPQRSVTVIMSQFADAAAHNVESVSGAQAHVPLLVQVSVALHVPQVPPQPSGPHVRPVHIGTHTPQRRPPSAKSMHRVPLGQAGTPETLQSIATQMPVVAPAEMMPQ